MQPQQNINIGTLSGALTHAASLLPRETALADSSARNLLKMVPGQQQALLLFVSARRLAGDLEGARDILQAFASAEPGLAAAHYELGMLLRDLGDNAKAIEELSRVVELEPQHPSAWRVLGDCLANAGDLSKAGHAYGEYFRSNRSEMRLLEDAAMLGPAQAGMAEAIFREALKVHPTDVPTLRALADLCMRQDRHGDAMGVLTQVLDLLPDFSPARYQRAVAAFFLKEWRPGIEDIEVLLKDDPEDSDYLNLYAEFLMSIGDSARAVGVFETLLKDHGERPEHWYYYGNALKVSGRTKDAVEAYRKGLSLGGRIGDGYWNLANVRSFKFTPDDVYALEAGLKDEKLEAPQKGLLNLALGRALEDTRSYETSFQHYELGNSILRKNMRYDANDTTALKERCKTTLTSQFFRKRTKFGSDAKDPIFVLGLPRSGSTLIEQILASHSAVEGTMELPDVAILVRQILNFERTRSEANYPAVLENLKARDFRTLGEQYIERTRIYRMTDRPRFIDKALNNIYHIGLIHLMLPNAKIIDIRRHPGACGFGIFRQYFGMTDHFFNDLTEIGQYYRDYVEVMAHFDKALPGRVHHVFYEQLVNDPDTQIRRLLDYCELPFEEACLNFHETKRSVRTASAEQVRQPIFKDAVDHWRHYEPWLGPLKSALGDTLTEYPDFSSHGD